MRVSIVIPVYKVEKTIHRCVDSVLSQTFTDYEIILVDDGSPDNSGEICDEYREKHENITVIHKENGGLSSARNAGLEIARGEYVMFLDSDDYLTDDCLEALAPHAADMIIGSIYCQMKDLKFHSQLPTEDRLIPRERFGEEVPGLLKENRINYVHAKLYHRQVITENKLSFEDDQLTSAEDTVFNFMFLAFAQSIYVSAKAVHYYTYNPLGLAHKSYLKRVPRGYRLWDFLTTSCKEMGLYTDEAKRVIDLRYLTYMNVLLKRLPDQAFSKVDKLRFVREMEAKTELKNLCSEYPDEPLDELEYLYANGSEALLRYVQKKRLRRELTRPFKRASYYVRMYTKEILIRLHIVKRQPKQKKG